MLLGCALASGCTFDTSGVPPTAPADLQLDASMVDLFAPAETGPPDLAGEQSVADVVPIDVAPIDMLPIDVVPPDTVAPDTLPPDTAPPPDTTPPTCDAKYGQAAQYALCVETPTSCEFFVKSGGDTCTTICGSFNGTCLGGYDNLGTCTHVGSSGCGKSLSGQICICSK